MTDQEDGSASSFLGRTRPGLVIAGLLLLAAFAIHGDALLAGFGRDDGGALARALTLTPSDYFLDPATSAVVSGMSVSPWNLLVYDLNLWLFGPAPGLHHLHLVLVVWLSSLATYAFLRLGLARAWSLAGALAFLVGVPTLYISHEEMSGHYLYGLLFTILSLHLFVLGVRHQRLGLRLSSALAYLLALACKEVYVPLPLVLLLYPDGGPARRWRETSLHWLLLLLYLVWRYVALGGSLIGPKGPGAEPVIAFRGLFAIPEALFGGSLPLAVLASLFGALLILNLRGRQWPFAGGVLLVLLMPLYPVAVNPGFATPDRLLYLIWWSACVAFAWAGSQVRGRLRLPALVLMTAFCLSALLAASPWRAEIERGKERWARYYSFARSPESGSLLYLPNDLESGYFSISGAVGGMREALTRLGLQRPEREVHLVTERRILEMIAPVEPDDPGRSYRLDQATNAIGRARDTEELRHWQAEIPRFVDLYLFETLPRYGLWRSGQVEEVRSADTQVWVSGWGPEGRLALAAPVRCERIEYELQDRPDVVAATGRADWLRAGFRIRIQCATPEHARAVASRLCVMVGARSFPAVLDHPSNPECGRLAEGSGLRDVAGLGER